MKNRKMVLCIVLMVSVAFFACAPQYDPESDFEASPQDGGKSVVITKYAGSKWEVRIPPKIQGLPVTHIGGGRYVGAFSGKKLINVTIPNGVTHIGDWAFSANQLTSVTIPNSVTHIGQEAFSHNEQLTIITIGNSVTSIGENAFITMGDSVISIGESVFSGCTSLTAINVAAGNSAFTSENGVLYNKNKTVLHKYPAGKTDSSFIIPNSITSIGDYAFSDCTNFTSLTIPNNVTSIGNSAFSGCNNLASLTISNSVTSIGKDAFYDCTGLTDRFIEVLRPLADIMSGYEDLPAQARRNRFDDLLPTALTSQPAILRAFIVWKRNAIDGMDSRYIGRAGSTPMGQYAPVFDKENGRLETLASADIDDTIAYINGPNSREDRVEPTPFKVNGQDTWILRIEMPIKNPRFGEVVGTVGGYCDIR